MKQHCIKTTGYWTSHNITKPLQQPFLMALFTIILFYISNFGPVDKIIWCDHSFWGARDGAVVRALASHQCGPSSNPGVVAICGLSLLLSFLSFAPRGFSLVTPVSPYPQKPTFPNSNSTRNQVDEEPLCGCTTSKALFILFQSLNET